MFLIPFTGSLCAILVSMERICHGLRSARKPCIQGLDCLQKGGSALLLRAAIILRQALPIPRSRPVRLSFCGHEKILSMCRQTGLNSSVHLVFSPPEMHFSYLPHTQSPLVRDSDPTHSLLNHPSSGEAPLLSAFPFVFTLGRQRSHQRRGRPDGSAPRTRRSGCASADASATLSHGLTVSMVGLPGMAKSAALRCGAFLVSVRVCRERHGRSE